MTELLFWEFRIGKHPVSFAIDIAPALLLGGKIDYMSKQSIFCGWYDLIICIGPFAITFSFNGSSPHDQR